MTPGQQQAKERTKEQVELLVLAQRGRAPKKAAK